MSKICEIGEQGALIVDFKFASTNYGMHFFIVAVESDFDYVHTDEPLRLLSTLAEPMILEVLWLNLISFESHFIAWVAEYTELECYLRFVEYTPCILLMLEYTLLEALVFEVTLQSLIDIVYASRKGYLSL